MRSNMIVTTARVVRAVGAVALLGGIMACAGTDAARTSVSTTRAVAMHEFALIFRPTRALEPEELPRRNAAARDWALARRRDGTLVGANPLEDEGVRVRQAGVTQVTGADAVASVLIIQAPDLDAAVALVRGHPGLAFGTEIEVRPVKAVAAPPP
jgi:hypothetical protein